MVDAGLAALASSTATAAVGWWQSDDTNRWMTAYVVYGLSLGKAVACRSTPPWRRAWPRVPHEPPRRGAPRPGRAHLDGLRPGLHRRRSQGRARQGLRAGAASKRSRASWAGAAGLQRQARPHRRGEPGRHPPGRQGAPGRPCGANDVWQTSRGHRGHRVHAHGLLPVRSQQPVGEAAHGLPAPANGGSGAPPGTPHSRSTPGPFLPCARRPPSPPAPSSSR